MAFASGNGWAGVSAHRGSRLKEEIVGPLVCECDEPKVDAGLCFWCGLKAREPKK